MLRRFCLLCVISCIAQTIYSQVERVYEWSWKKESLILGGGGALLGGSSHLKSRVDPSSESFLGDIAKFPVLGLDKGALSNYSIASDALSDKFLFGSLTLPFLTYLDRDVRKEKGAVAGMAFEALLVTGGITNMVKTTVRRPRPFLYNIAGGNGDGQHLEADDRQSFLSGHTSMVATSSFFAAQVMIDLHPESSLKPLIWGAAATIPAVTGYLRYRAGKHFPTDIIAGYGLGALIGTMIPKLHRIEIGKEASLSLGPIAAGGAGFSFNMQL